jgi:glutaminase
VAPAILDPEHLEGVFLASYGNLENPVGRVLDHYVRHCAIAMSCAELALAGGFLARHGVRRDGSRRATRSRESRPSMPSRP